MKGSSRQAIFSRLKAALPESASLPDLGSGDTWQRFDDPLARFQEVLESVGGRVFHARNLSEANADLRADTGWASASVRCSVVPGLGDSTIDLHQIDDPHELENVDFAILRGHFGVAENGAVWVTDATVRHRVLYFIPQRIALAVPASAIVHNMHEAYERIRPADFHFSAFISGPSKTADIEQSLVIGAHGARSLVVYLIAEDF